MHNFLGDLVGRHEQGFIQVDIALGDASARVPEQARDGQLRESQVTGYAGEGMSKNMRRDVLELSGQAKAN